MLFTYNSYKELLNLLKEHQYEFTDYFNWEKESKSVILRHDIDNDIEKALQLANVENRAGGYKKYLFCTVNK